MVFVEMDTKPFHSGRGSGPSGGAGLSDYCIAYQWLDGLAVMPVLTAVSTQSTLENVFVEASPCLAS